MEYPTKCSVSVIVSLRRGKAIPRVTVAGSLGLLASLVLVACMPNSATAVERTERSAGQQRFQALFPLVQAGRGCTQEDAPAAEIYFFAKKDDTGEPVAPYVRVEISGLARERIPPATFRLMPLRRNPNERRRIVRAELVQKPGSSLWLDGSIAIRADNPQTGITGRIDLISPKGEAWSRAFSARYANRQAVCG